MEGGIPGEYHQPAYVRELDTEPQGAYCEGMAVSAAKVKRLVSEVLDGLAENSMEIEGSHGDARFEEFRLEWAWDLQGSSDETLEEYFEDLVEEEGVTYDQIRKALRVLGDS